LPNFSEDDLLSGAIEGGLIQIASVSRGLESLVGISQPGYRYCRSRVQNQPGGK
jgi:hypothetical protein